MRTAGTFQEVYAAAKSYYNNTAEDGCPHNPVVRRENGRWMLESGLTSAEDSDFQVDLEAFDSWFYERYSDDDYTPSDTTVDDFVNAHQVDDENE